MNLKKLNDEFRDKHHCDFHIICVNEMGNVFEVITEIAKSYNADVIVMGIVGEASKIREHLIGSTTVNVARHSAIPTLIVP